MTKADELREIAAGMTIEERPHTAPKIDRAAAHIDEIARAAIAVIRRWESPDWKDGRHTAEYIAELRRAVEAAGYEVPQ